MTISIQRLILCSREQENGLNKIYKAIINACCTTKIIEPAIFAFRQPTKIMQMNIFLT